MNAPLFAVLFGILQVASSDGTEIKVRTTLVPDSVRVGERAWLSVSVSGITEGDEIHFPELPDTGLFTGLGAPRLVYDRSGRTRSAQYELAGWRAGDLEIRLGDLRVIRGATETLLPLPAVRLLVASVLPADVELESLDWRPQADVSGPSWSLAEKLLVAGLVLGVTLAFLVYLRGRGTGRPVPSQPPRPARERALEALTGLQVSGLLQAGELKAFYSNLSQIVREYMAETEPAWGLDLTTHELVDATVDRGLSEIETLTLDGLLGGADLVKFAKRRPSFAEADNELEVARSWIASFQPALLLGSDDSESDRTEEVGSEALSELDSIFAGDGTWDAEDTAT